MTDASLVERRLRALGPGLRQFYDFPFHPVRGEGVRLYDAEGLEYLDAYNNVPHVGHGHPHVVAAIARQAARLNGNTRYLDETILDYAERLLASLPRGLDTAVFVCTGSEANDLALRLARAFTGGSGATASTTAYHGNTVAISALDVSRSPDPPQPWVATVPPPPEGDPDGTAYERGFEQAIAALAGRGHRLAAAYFDTTFANEGLDKPTPAQMERAVGRIHGAGGLYVADEIQAGLGRMGDAMWGFQRLGATPDLVTMGKPMGNGHPIGILVTRREILEAFHKRDRYFNTFGGNPVSCAAGIAVLEVMERERLQANAACVGAYLTARLDEISRQHGEIGRILGAGFFQGVEVRRPSGEEPAPDAARRVMNEMARRGVLVGLTGPARNLLKIRPPMVFARADADRLAETLDAVLADGFGQPN
jgi:4-aminobutyrate aminotransferase-like enzyme